MVATHHDVGWGGGWGGVCNNVHVTCVTFDVTLLRPTMMWGGVGVGWGGVGWCV